MWVPMFFCSTSDPLLFPLPSASHQTLVPMAALTTFENREELVSSVRPPLSASMCLASQPRHLPMTRPVVQATRLTDTRLRVSHLQQV